jgi:thymidylate synthase (FAD)
MNVITPYAKLMPLASPYYDGTFTEEHGKALLRHVEWCARISHRSEDAVTEDSYERLIRSVVLQHGDWSVVEHAAVSVDFYVDRGITHEIVRHRLFAFTQESTRFVNYEKKIPPSFVQPALSDEAKKVPNGERCELSPLEVWRHAIGTAESSYRRLIGAGVAPQIARSVFPNSLASRLIVTGNLRNWRHFFLMRTSKEAHPQMREVTIPLLAEFKAKIPILYEDIEPLATQRQNLEKGR